MPGFYNTTSANTFSAVRGQAVCWTATAGEDGNSCFVVHAVASRYWLDVLIIPPASGDDGAVERLRDANIACDCAGASAADSRVAGSGGYQCDSAAATSGGIENAGGGRESSGDALAEGECGRQPAGGGCGAGTGSRELTPRPCSCHSCVPVHWTSVCRCLRAWDCPAARLPQGAQAPGCAPVSNLDGAQN
jgi:hypothetical protein